MNRLLSLLLGAALAFSLSSAASAQTDMDVHVDTTAQVTTTSSGSVITSDRFVTIHRNLGLTPDQEVRFRTVINEEMIAVDPFFDEADIAIRADLRPDQVATYNEIMTDATRYALIRMSPSQYAAFRSELSSRLELTPAQQSTHLMTLDRAVARASELDRASYSYRYCEILGMDRHEAYDREVASVQIFEERVARTVEVEAQRREVAPMQTEEFIRDVDLK